MVKERELLMQLTRKKGNDPMKVNQYKQVIYLTFPLLEETGMVRHLFSTREGGVSEGVCKSMNLSYARGDDSRAVDENFRRIAEIFESTSDKIVCSKQTHTTNIRKVTKEDCGKGVTSPLDYDDVDGLITNEPEIILSTFYADCVPLYFIDTKNKAIGLGHSGWRGTVDKMGEKMLIAMKEAYGTDPENVVAAIGPSICQECYEVGSEVAEVFRENFPNDFERIVADGKAEGKYQLNLWEANKTILLSAGIHPDKLAVTDLCTCCNSEVLFSHRASNGKRGNLGAFMELRKS